MRKGMGVFNPKPALAMVWVYIDDRGDRGRLIARRAPSKWSPMPSGLLNQLTQDEILDLLAAVDSAEIRLCGEFQDASGQHSN